MKQISLIFLIAILLTSCTTKFYVATNPDGETIGFRGKPVRSYGSWNGRGKQELPNIWGLTWDDEPLLILTEVR